MKLSKTQEKCLERMKYDIDKARENDFRSWCIINQCSNNEERYDKNIEYYEKFRMYYDRYKKGEVLVSGYGKPTLNALMKQNIVTVISYEENRKNGVIDWVKLNNY